MEQFPPPQLRIFLVPHLRFPLLFGRLWFSMKCVYIFFLNEVNTTLVTLQFRK